MPSAHLWNISTSITRDLVEGVWQKTDKVLEAFNCREIEDLDEDSEKKYTKKNKNKIKAFNNTLLIRFVGDK
ncbi:hypothetical protein BY996DRAFT_8402842 [Phakopsora pachyrhizi]|nr:hypothetical protein BY996DRAFT_8402842 [Phakopsora pachyrhizi]